MNNRIFYVIALLAVSWLLSACGPAANTTTPTANGNGATAGKELKLAFVTNNASDYWTIARKGVEKADAEMNDVTVEFKLPGSGAADEQKRIIDDLL